MTPSGARTCAVVWELTAYTNGCVSNTNHFSGELHRPIPQLGVSYGLSSLTELPPPIHSIIDRYDKPPARTARCSRRAREPARLALGAAESGERGHGGSGVVRAMAIIVFPR